MTATRRLFIPTILLALLWLVLAENQLSSWLIGIPFIALALLAVPPGRQQPVTFRVDFAGLIRFLRLFIVESIRGGIDVSRRVLAKQPMVNPGFFTYPIRLQGKAAKKLFVGSISLLPGTLCADWIDETAHIHTLDNNSLSVEAVQVLELHIAALFGETL